MSKPCLGSSVEKRFDYGTLRSAVRVINSVTISGYEKCLLNFVRCLRAFLEFLSVSLYGRRENEAKSILRHAEEKMKEIQANLGGLKRISANFTNRSPLDRQF